MKDGKLEMRALPGDKKKETLECANIGTVALDADEKGCKFSIISKSKAFFFFTTVNERDCQEWFENVEVAVQNLTKANFASTKNSHMLF